MGSIRSAGAAPPVSPKPVTLDELAPGKYPFDLVSMEGTVVTQVREHAQDLYMISADGNLLTASLRARLHTIGTAPQAACQCR